MSSNMMAPRPQEKPKMTATSSPSFSQLGRSPSIGGPPGYTTDDIIAAQNLRCARWLHILRISINAFTLAASIAVVACAASSLRSYSQSHVDPEWLLPLWPLHVDLRPSHAVLACGIIVAIFSLAYMAVAFVPLPRKLHHLNLASTILSFLALFVTLFTTVFACVITNNHASSTASGTLNSWTCKWQGFDDIAPANFMAICNEGTAGLDVVILLVIVEFLAVAVSAWGWWVEMRLKRVSIGGEKSEIELV